MIKLDDFLSKKKEPAQVLDLSKVKITSKEDFKRYFDKIPECKVKPEKISTEQVKVKEKDFTFLPGKKEEKQVREWSYPDPTPPDMKGVKLEDLCPINIDWKMLTTNRPKSKVEEDMFSRLVQLGKLDLKYQQALQRERMTNWVRRTKNPKSSIIEMRVISCKECMEDFCDGAVCSKLTYENFFRPQPTTTNLNQNLLLAAAEVDVKKPKRRKKKKRKHRTKKKGEGSPRRRKKLGKTSIFNRPASTGCTRDHFRYAKEDATADKFRSRALSSTRSFSCERRQVRLVPKRPKSAPRIHFECEAPPTEFKRQDYVSDTGLSNTDYSSQSDSESTHQKFFGPRLRLSGRRKLISARVSFADRRQLRDSAEKRSKFKRKCTLFKDCCGDTGYRRYRGGGSRSSESSSPARSRFRVGGSVSGKPPSTVQIEFDETFSTSGLQFPERKLLPISVPSNLTKTRRVATRKPPETGKPTENLTKTDSDVTRQESDRSNRGSTKKEKTASGSCWDKTSETCLKAKGLFGKTLDHTS